MGQDGEVLFSFLPTPTYLTYLSTCLSACVSVADNRLCLTLMLNLPALNRFYDHQFHVSVITSFTFL